MSTNLTKEKFGCVTSVKEDILFCVFFSFYSLISEMWANHKKKIDLKVKTQVHSLDLDGIKLS